MTEVIFTPPQSQRVFTTEKEKLAWPIWNEKWMVKMRYQDTLDADELRTFAFKTSGDEYIDHCHQVELLQVGRTIAEIAQLASQKIEVSLVNEADSKPMFLTITAYLRHWHAQLERNINVGKAPIEDLIALDKLAASLFVFAAQYLQGDYAHSAFGALVAAGGLGRNAFAQKAALPERSAQKMPTYDSFEAFFLRRAV